MNKTKLYYVKLRQTFFTSCCNNDGSKKMKEFCCHQVDEAQTDAKKKETTHGCCNHISASISDRSIDGRSS